MGKKSKNNSKIKKFPKIIDFKGFHNIYMIYASQMAKYDVYTDYIFVSNTFMCSDQYGVGITSISFLIISLIITCHNFIKTLQDLSKETLKGNAGYINEMTKLSFIIEI